MMLELLSGYISNPSCKTHRSQSVSVLKLLETSHVGLHTKNSTCCQLKISLSSPYCIPQIILFSYTFSTVLSYMKECA